MVIANPSLLNNIIRILIVVASVQLIYHIFFYFIKRWARQQKRIFPSLLSKYIYFPGLFFIFMITGWVALLILEDHLSIYMYGIIKHALLILLTIITAFLLMRVVTVMREVTLHHYSTNEPLNYSFRKAKTKFQLIQRVFNFLVILATLSIVLMTFSSIRQIGTTLLASAGVVGLIIGFAAQKSLGTLFAGLQIAISQPIRIDDIVVVEEQFGTIAEITLTFVVINSWDGRRLIVPISYFLEKPFENWTRMSPEVVSKVKIYADYTLPIENVRTELKRLLDSSPFWDKRSWGLVVTASDAKAIEVRATMSAKNSDDAYTLECMIREKLIAFIRENYPASLPVSRIILNQPGDKQE